jgi:hypothetical protein
MIKKILGLDGKPNHYLWFYGIIILICASNILMPLFMSAVGRWNDSTGRNLSFVENYRAGEKPNLLFWGENIPANDGFGFDGVAYANICKEFPGILNDKEKELFRKKRFIPSAMAWVVIKTTPLNFSDPVHIVLAFRIVAFLALLLSVFLFISICGLLKLSDVTTWLAYIGLFINYMVLKRTMYYSVDTGAVAFLCGFMFIYFYLRRSLIGLLITTIFAVYTWELVSLFALPLFMFPRRATDDALPQQYGHAKWMTAIAFFGVCCYIPLYLFYGVIYDEEAYFGDTALVRSVVPLSLIFVLGYIYYGARTVLSQFRIKGWKSFSGEFGILSFVTFIILMFIVKLSLKYMHVLSLPLTDVMHGWSLRPVIQPAIFYVAHVVFFGPIIVFVILLWRDIVAAARKIGLGLLLAIAVTMALSLNSESRHLTLAIVPVIFLAAKVLERFKVSKDECILFGVVSLLYSKVWMLMNIGNVPPDNVLIMPWQRYFMSCGPWMSNSMYVVQGTFVLVTTVALWLWIKEKKKCTKSLPRMH